MIRCNNKNTLEYVNTEWEKLQRDLSNIHDCWYSYHTSDPFIHPHAFVGLYIHYHAFIGLYIYYHAFIGLYIHPHAFMAIYALSCIHWFICSFSAFIAIYSLFCIHWQNSLSCIHCYVLIVIYCRLIVVMHSLINIYCHVCIYTLSRI